MENCALEISKVCTYKIIRKWCFGFTCEKCHDVFMGGLFGRCPKPLVWTHNFSAIGSYLISGPNWLLAVRFQASFQWAFIKQPLIIGYLHPHWFSITSFFFCDAGHFGSTCVHVQLFTTAPPIIVRVRRPQELMEKKIEPNTFF